MQARIKNLIADLVDKAELLPIEILMRPHIPDDVRTKQIALTGVAASALVAQTIIFPALQAEVFAELARDYTEKLDYALPFDEVIIEFDQAIQVNGRKLYGIVLSHDQFDRDDFEDFEKRYKVLYAPGEDKTMLLEHAELHRAWGIYADGTYGYVVWHVADRSTFFGAASDPDTTIKNLAIACIAYINCENVTLVKQQGAPPAVNNKRNANGKKALEDFYICKIKGVQYETEDKRDPSGRHVSFRFDVRGHFRRMDDGRTTWVRAHQRGIKNEVYRPKVYKA